MGLWIGTQEDFNEWADLVNSQLNIFGLSIKDVEEDNWDFNRPGYYSVFFHCYINL